MKKYLFTLVVSLLLINAYGQTYVSGGIYSNTTWTLANSPYYADTVVVFPGVTLTIEPGVVVIVDRYLEIRQASLFAEGTINDSITFIGRLFILHGDTLPTTVINFNNAFLSKLNYCIIKDTVMGSIYSSGISARMNSNSDSLFIKNSYFTNNGVGIYFYVYSTVVDSCVFINNITATEQTNGIITNSIFRKNQFGISNARSSKIINCIIDSNSVLGINLGQLDTIINCQITNNKIGVLCDLNSTGLGSQIHNNIIEDNGIGIQLSDNASPDSIFCNRICNNITFNLKNTNPANRKVANNYWCSNDSLLIANSIYDGYDNTSVGLINFMPIDTLHCYSVTDIQTYESQAALFDIFPNPALDKITIEISTENFKTGIEIFNMFGRKVNSTKITSQRSSIDISNLKKGAYIIQLSNGESIGRQKLIIQ